MKAREEIVELKLEVVFSSLCGDAGQSAREFPEFGRIRIRVNPQIIDRFDGKIDGVLTRNRVRYIRAIDQQAALIRSSSADVDGSVRASNNRWYQGDRILEFLLSERQVGELLIRYFILGRRFVLWQQLLAFALDRHRLLDRSAGWKNDFERPDIGSLQIQLRRDRLESGKLCRQAVVSWL